MNMNMKMQKQQSGFTLIELVIVLVILGILAAVAIPRFVDLSDEAEQAALEGVVGNMASAMAINFAACSAKDHDASQDGCVSISGTCSSVDSILQGGIPEGYSVSGSMANSTNGVSADCTVTAPDGKTEIFTGISAGL